MAVKKDLSITYLGVRCENPFFLSSSPVGGNYDMVAKCFEAGWGGVFFKTVGIFVADECSPRFDNTGKEGLPWIGFKNMEQISDKPTEQNFEYLYRLKRDYPDKVVVASIMGSSVSEWAKLAKMCDQAGVDLIEGNFSCPQMTSHAMGSDVGSDPALVEKYTRAVVKATKIPFIAKMTPNITKMEPPARAAARGGAKGVSAINTLKSITHIDLDHLTALPVVNGKSSISGYSGAAVRPVALRFVANLCADDFLRRRGVEVSGIGGIETWRDALEFLLLGCRNLQVTTAVMQYGYRIVEDMAGGLSHWMDERGHRGLEDFIGGALANIIPAEELDRSFRILPAFHNRKCVGCGRCYVSCYDGAHQAIGWDARRRRPVLDEDKCVGCHLCLNVCPVAGCITPGAVRWKGRAKKSAPAVQEHYD
ncbi:MAG: NAD-dependent dihydropyrimidine dehydrogenase subunit PreA [Clostridiales Family XIII bacterium]|jgi:dihydropyrimidine dehydrogenase (NAD+) subunit PreA|nr:NAD-dependent dihydropyrimidine dehydrogenase subunit PreA [Clostridiales Family XIII bacterium]